MIKELDIITNKFREEYLKSPERRVDLANENIIKTLEKHIQKFIPSKKSVRIVEHEIEFVWDHIDFRDYFEYISEIMRNANKCNKRSEELRKREIKIDDTAFNILHTIEYPKNDLEIPPLNLPQWKYCYLFPIEGAYDKNYKGNEISSIKLEFIYSDLIDDKTYLRLTINMKLKEDD